MKLGVSKSTILSCFRRKTNKPDLHGFKSHFKWYPDRLFNKKSLAKRQFTRASTKIDEYLSIQSSNLQDAEKFNWFQNWWAVQVQQNLKTDKPNEIQLLHKDFIIWKGSGENWIAMSEESLHKGDSLSDGWIDTDQNLLCTQSGFCFDENGKYVKIPDAKVGEIQSNDEKALLPSVHTYPCKTFNNILWLWPDDSLFAKDNAANTPLPIDDDSAEDLRTGSQDASFSPYIRYLPYSFDVLMENIVDVSHIPVSHHGTLPFLRREYAHLTKVNASEKRRVLPLSYSTDFDVPPDACNARCELRLPGCAIYYFEKEQNLDFQPSICAFAAPKCPGWSLIIVLHRGGPIASKFTDSPILGRQKKVLIDLLIHALMQNRILDGDSILLYNQDKNIRKQGLHFESSKSYFMPTKVDMLVLAFRKWFETVGEHGAPYGGTQEIDHTVDLKREELLDRYNQHTKHCTLCNSALKKIMFTTNVFKFIAATSFLIAFTLFSRQFHFGSLDMLSLVRNAKLMASTILCLLSVSVVSLFERRIIPQFYFVDHVHQDIG